MKMTPELMDRILAIMTPLVEEDVLLRTHEVLSEMIPPKELAADSALKRRQFLAMDSRKRSPVSRTTAPGRALSPVERAAFDSRKGRPGSPIPATDIAKIAAAFPNMDRMQ